MRSLLATAQTALLIVMGCAGGAPTEPRSAPVPAPSPRAYEAPTPLPSASTSGAAAAVDAELRRDADAAVAELAALLAQIEVDCGAKWLASEAACDGAPFSSMATRYQRLFGSRPDPRASQGRIDALPRLGGPGETDATVVARMAAVCAERCNLSRRSAVAEAIEAAVERCAAEPKVGRKACEALAARAGSPSTAMASQAAERCEDECASRGEQARREAERERARPRNLPQSRVCFRACMVRCTGGRIVPPLDRPFVSPADEWCGTCQFSCESECAVR